ncbi:MAG: hypothetical protein IPK19_03225 [Chloroflexi bacterium]|nr:hypothetical protein [Chloroflexota bacterium]
MVDEESREPVMAVGDVRDDAGNAEESLEPTSSEPTTAPASESPETPIAGASTAAEGSMVAASEPGRRSGFFGRLGRLIVPDGGRLRELDRAITRNPEEPGSYLARGELLLLRRRRGDEEAAAVDFYKAVHLAEAQFEEDDWGIGAQLVRDRALAELNALMARGIVLEFEEDRTLRSDVETVQSEHSPE